MGQMYLYNIMTDEIRKVNLREETPFYAKGADGTRYLASRYVWAKEKVILEAVRETAKDYRDLWSWDEEEDGVQVRFVRNYNRYGEDLAEKRFCLDASGNVKVIDMEGRWYVYDLQEKRLLRVSASVGRWFHPKGAENEPDKPLPLDPRSYVWSRDLLQMKQIGGLIRQYGRISDWYEEDGTLYLLHPEDPEDGVKGTGVKLLREDDYVIAAVCRHYEKEYPLEPEIEWPV